MKWALDIDGVITANPSFFKWFTYHLKKKYNNNTIYIVSSRNPDRVEETVKELDWWDITYDKLYTMPVELPRDYASQATWKVQLIRDLNPNIWMDNEFKVYEKALGVVLDTPGTERIQI